MTSSMQDIRSRMLSGEAREIALAAFNDGPLGQGFKGSFANALQAVIEHAIPDAERLFTLEEVREILTLRDVAVDFARRRWDALGRDEDFDDIGFVRYGEGVRRAESDLALVAAVLASPDHNAEAEEASS